MIQCDIRCIVGHKNMICDTLIMKDKNSEKQDAFHHLSIENLLTQK